MFDFLAEEGAEKQRRKKRSEAATERPLPIIRRPVPVSQSGPLLPPKPGAPVAPPPELTSGSSTTSDTDDLDFLDDMPARRPVAKTRKPRAPESDSDSNITRLDSRSKRTRTEADPTAVTRRVSKPARFNESDDFDDIQLNLDDSPEFGRGRGVGRTVVEPDDFDEETRPGRGRWLALALVLIAAGAGSFAFTNSPELRALLTGFGLPDGSSSGTDDVIVSTDDTVSPDDNRVVSEPSEMMQRFSEQLSLVEGLIDNGDLDDAEQALSSMDRTVYGYGAREFGELENRIEQVRSGVVEPAVNETSADDQLAEAEAARLAGERAAQAERERLVAAEQASRDAAERARIAEQTRVAEQARAEQARAEQARAEQARAEQARAEQARAEQARAEQARAEQARAEQAALDEQARIDAEQQAQAEQAEEARIAAAEQSVRQEQSSTAATQVEQAAAAARQEAARLEQLRQEQQAAQIARTSDWPAPDRDRQATDRRIAEERAALQRQEAREQRLVEAREREAALAAQAESAVQTESEESTEAYVDIPPVVDAREEQTSKAIDDDELQIVYRRFIELQRAISGRDINAVVGLTERSGVRVQQFMQIFENSTQIDARIRNVSTNNATGEIKGTLQINRIQRANGTFVEPPSALSSIPLSSTREGDGWSAIVW
ncbi:Chromosome partition protein Smc [Granulosicoccus antarcticus IMCC3135]|uniref:Chromosome partition protein Smc n=2 Tax=Granulosicoccus TaxID=437504 RepID=A0A2Z2NPI0_9GAMM|nr:Chromosome partition protein Smc [Granulosicoccus antarcticus IMCC3135]